MKLVIKIGGTLVDEPEKRGALAQQIASAASKPGVQLVIVHGGGKQLSKQLEARGIQSRFIGGLRVTGEAAMDTVIQVLTGTVNKSLVGSLRAAGVPAVGISGVDGGLATAVQMSPELGQVGRIDATDPSVLDLLTLGRFVPVVACVAGDQSGAAWNVNADQMASACAAAFHADRLIFLTDVAGVLGGDGVLVPSLTVDEAAGLVAAGVAKGGMQAKLEAASAALLGGVGAVAIAGGAEPGVLEALLSGHPVGTDIRRKLHGSHT